jgi:hypothetical protein
MAMLICSSARDHPFFLWFLIVALVLFDGIVGKVLITAITPTPSSPMSVVRVLSQLREERSHDPLRSSVGKTYAGDDGG